MTKHTRTSTVIMDEATSGFVWAILYIAATNQDLNAEARNAAIEVANALTADPRFKLNPI